MRFNILKIFVYVGLLALGIGLFRVQVVKGDYYRRLGENNRIRLIPLEAARGRVFDMKGNLLASNRASYDVIATPEDVTPEVYYFLSNIFSITEDEIRERMSAPREYPFAPALIMKDVSRELAFKVEELKAELPGVSVRTSGLRYYPYKETASHLIGYIGKINPREYKTYSRDQYGMNSLVGRSGIEKIYDGELRGWRGGRQLEVDARGRLVRVISEKKPIPGKDLKVTLDLEFQKAIMKLIEDKNASVAVMDLKTDGLIALASTPSYDPNVFVAPGHGQERLDILKNPKAPMLDRGTSSAYPPGSVFKLVTAIAALEEGKITPHTTYNCNGQFRIKPGTRPFRCWLEGGHGPVNLYEAIERSCNVYFYNLGKRLSSDKIARYARELGLGERMQLEITSIAPGLVPDSAWKKQKYKEKWYQGETLSFAIGQSYLLTSPLQILRLVSIIAKDGKQVHPRLIYSEKIDDSSDKVAIKKENLKAIKKAMLQVVESNYGTGQLARVDFDKWQLKQGQLKVPPNEAHSWLAGFSPIRIPKFRLSFLWSMVVRVE